jgi:hypothetical protein
MAPRRMQRWCIVAAPTQRQPQWHSFSHLKVPAHLLLLTLLMVVAAPVNCGGKFSGSSTQLRSDDPLLQRGYFAQEPFRSHSSVSWLLDQLNMSHSGMGSVAAARETGDDNMVRVPGVLRLHPQHYMWGCHFLNVVRSLVRAVCSVREQDCVVFLRGDEFIRRTRLTQPPPPPSRGRCQTNRIARETESTRENARR